MLICVEICKYNRTPHSTQAYAAQQAAGMDKFKTMKKAQSGDAARRVEDFENLEDTEC